MRLSLDERLVMLGLLLRYQEFFLGHVLVFSLLSVLRIEAVPLLVGSGILLCGLDLLVLSCSGGE
jgi:hypothetical protein